MQDRFRFRIALAVVVAAGVLAALNAQAPSVTPVTDAMLQDPPAESWLMWRRTLNGWGFSPLDEIDRTNVGDLRMVWSRGLGPGAQQGTPLVHDGVMFMPNPRDIIEAIDAATGDLHWRYQRARPDDLDDYLIDILTDMNRNLAIYGNAHHRHKRRRLRLRARRGDGGGRLGDRNPRLPRQSGEPEQRPDHC